MNQTQATPTERIQRDIINSQADYINYLEGLTLRLVEKKIAGKRPLKQLPNEKPTNQINR